MAFEWNLLDWGLRGCACECCVVVASDTGKCPSIRASNEGSLRFHNPGSSCASRRFQPGEGPCRMSLLRDCEIFANLRLKLYLAGPGAAMFLLLSGNFATATAAWLLLSGNFVSTLPRQLARGGSAGSVLLKWTARRSTICDEGSCCCWRLAGGGSRVRGILMKSELNL